MTRALVGLALASGLWAGNVAAQENLPSRIYVAEVAADPSAGMQPAELLLLGETLRRTALETLEGSRFRVISREEVEQFNEAVDGKMCLQGECITEDAEKLTADHAMEARLLRVANVFNLNVKLHAVKDKTLVAQVEAQAGEFEALRARTADEVRRMLQRKLLKHAGGLEGATLEIPVLELARPGTLSLQAINVDADELFESAMKLHGDAAVKPELKRDTWCRLSGIQDRNRYLEVAARSCDGWRKYVDNLNRLRDSIARDYDTVRRVLRLSTYTREQKLSLLDEFANTYSPFPADQRVVFARDVKRLVARDGRAELPELKLAPPGREGDIRAAEEERARQVAARQRQEEVEKAERRKQQEAAKAKDPNAPTGRKVGYLGLRTITPAFFVVQLGLTVVLGVCGFIAFLGFAMASFSISKVASNYPFVYPAAGAAAVSLAVGVVHGAFLLGVFVLASALGGQAFTMGEFFSQIVTSPIELFKAPMYAVEFIQALAALVSG
ncbi:MAG: hypothetical protein HY904_20305 [Deltaproteobacteria bacterium]|nr:hypothetical protein [Deltaproteobacteria bacterium]